MDIIGIELFIIGLFFGSFFDCIANRLSKGESIIKPGSHCENCKHKLSWYELIPVFSFIFQKGRIWAKFKIQWYASRGYFRLP